MPFPSELRFCSFLKYSPRKRPPRGERSHRVMLAIKSDGIMGRWNVIEYAASQIRQNLESHRFLQEAACEIHFQHAENSPWLPSLPGDLFKRLQRDFPHMEPLINLGLQFEVGPQGLGQRVMPPSPRARFIHKSGTWMVHLAQGQLTINQMKPYPGWESFRSQVQRTWSEAARVIKPGRILRIGLRYINQIPLNGIRPEEVRVLYRDEKGYTQARRASDLPGVQAFIQAGAQMGYIWLEGHLGIGDPLVNAGGPLGPRGSE